MCRVKLYLTFSASSYFLLATLLATVYSVPDISKIEKRTSNLKKHLDFSVTPNTLFLSFKNLIHSLKSKIKTVFVAL